MQLGRATPYKARDRPGYGLMRRSEATAGNCRGFFAQIRWVDFQAGERVWVVNAPHPVHGAGQRPSPNGFSAFGHRGRFPRGGVARWVGMGKSPGVSGIIRGSRCGA